MINRYGCVKGTVLVLLMGVLYPAFSGQCGEEAKPRPLENETVQVLIQQLKSGHDEQQVDAADALVTLGPLAVTELMNVLNSEDEKIGWLAAFALGKIGPPAALAVPDLVQALKHGKRNVRIYAAFALGEIGPATKSAVVRDLIDALQDPDDGVLMFAAEALGKFGSAAVPSLIEALKDDKEKVRGFAAHALVNIGPAAIPELLNASQSEDKKARVLAADVLKRIQASTIHAARPEELKRLETSSIQGGADGGLR